MLTRKLGALASTFALGLLAACSGPSDATSTDEAAVTNDEAKPQNAAERISSIAKICSYGGDKADITTLIGRIATFSSCAKDDEPGIGVLMDMEKGEYLLLGEGKEVHRPRFSPVGKKQFVHWASMSRKEGGQSIVVHVEELGGAKKDIEFFDLSLEDSPERLQQRLASFDVKISPDGKTAIVYGFEQTADGYEGRLVVAPLDKEGQVTLAPSKGISPDADVTFAPDGSRALILSTMGSKALEAGETPSQHVYDVELGAEPTLTESPAWVLNGVEGAVVLAPGSFTGREVLRFGGGELSLARIDGSVVELSKTLGITNEAPAYATDAAMHDLHSQAAFTIVPSAGKAAYVFAGTNEANETGIYLANHDGDTQKVVSNAAVDGAGFAAAYHEGRLLYPAKGGVGYVKLADPASAKLVATDTEAKSFRGVDLSLNGAMALVETTTDTAVGYQTVIIGTGDVRELKLPAGAALRPFGTLEGEWADEACGYDAVASIKVMDYGRVVALTSFSADKASECARKPSAPELLGFDEAGVGTKVAFSGFVTGAGAPSLALQGGSSFGAGPFDRGVVTQCGLEGDLCAAYIEVAPGYEAKAEAPAKPGTQPGTNEPGADEGDEGTTGMPEGAPTKPAKPSKPGADDVQDDDSSDDGVVVTKRPPSRATNSATTTEAQVTLPPVPGVTAGGCSAAPGSAGPTGFGLAFLLGLGVLGRRRRSDGAAR